MKEETAKTQFEQHTRYLILSFFYFHILVYVLRFIFFYWGDIL